VSGRAWTRVAVERMSRRSCIRVGES
jgi:hypothetical protein